LSGAVQLQPYYHIEAGRKNDLAGEFLGDVLQHLKALSLQRFSRFVIHVHL
jgi:hypothetical protein